MKTRTLAVALLLLLVLHASSRHALAQTATDSYAINASEQVSAEDLGYVNEGIRLAQHYLAANFGVEVTHHTIVNVRATGAPTNPGEVGESGENYVTIYTKSQGWYSAPPFSRLGTVIHEYIHVYQRDQLKDGMALVPAWMIEGSAEYLSTDALVADELVSRIDADAYRSWALATGPELRPLAEYESIQAFQQESANIYALSYFGMEYLATDHGVQSIGDFFALVGQGARWQDAFASAFGIEPASFYTAFAKSREELILPTNPPPAYTDLDPQELDASISAIQSPASTFTGDQLIVTARSEPDARCIFYLSGDTLDLTQETTVDGAGDLFWIVTIPEDTPAQQAEFSMDCGGGEAAGSVDILIETSGNHPTIRDEP